MSVREGEPAPGSNRPFGRMLRVEGALSERLTSPESPPRAAFRVLSFSAAAAAARTRGSGGAATRAGVGDFTVASFFGVGVRAFIGAASILGFGGVLGFSGSALRFEACLATGAGSV